MIIGATIKKFFIFLFIATLLGGGFLGILASSQKAKAVEVNWSRTDFNLKEHHFQRLSDGTIKDIISSTDADQASITVEYKNRTSIKFWDFFDKKDYPPKIAQLQWEELQRLTTKTYSLYQLPGLDSFYLITDDSTNSIKGIFKKGQGNCRTSTSASSISNETLKKIPCPYEYFLAYENVGSNPDKVGDLVWVVSEQGPQSSLIGVTFTHNVSDADSKTLLYSYITTTNTQQQSLIGGKCAKAGAELSAQEYADCFFPDGGHFQNLKIQNNGDKPPSIFIPGKDNFSGYPDAKRPNITFTLDYILQSTGAAKAIYFYFVAKSPSYPNLALRIKDCDASSQPIVVTKAKEALDDDYLPKAPIFSYDRKTFYDNLINKAYKGGPYTDPNCPSSEEIDSTGQLSKWGVTTIQRDESHGVDEGTCGVSWNLTLSGLVASSIAKVLCTILYMIGDAGSWLIEKFGIDKVINAFHQTNFIAAISPGVSTAHAADISSIKNALDGNESPWVLTSWKTMLGLANVFVVVVLLFLAITNIMQIPYDTYAIKKALPILIMGIILANFSILITKMLVDATNVLTATFMGDKSASDMFKNLVTAIIPGTGTSAVSLNTLGSLMIAIIFAFLSLIAFLVLGFLFFIRYAVILALTAVAPLAFVLMAFPPTQGFFKQWWKWYANFIFMKPVSIFLVWLAYEVLSSTCKNNWASCETGFTQWALATVLLYAAIIIPFKMGGAVMGAWGKAGKWASGTGKEGYARKPVDKWIGRFKRDIGTKAINRFPFLGAGAAKEKQSQANRQASLDQGELNWERGHTGVAIERERNESVKRDLKTLQDKRKRQIWEGTLSGQDENWWKRYRFKHRTGAKDKGEYMNRLVGSMTESQKATEAVSKSAQWDLFAKLSTDSRLSNDLQADLKDMLKQETKNLEGFELEADGSVKFNGKLDTKIGDYDYDIDSLQKMADKETNPEVKTKLIQSITELRRKSDDFKISNPRVGMEKFELKDDGGLNFTGAIDTDWTDYMQTSDVLLLQSKAEAAANPKKSRKLYQSAMNLRNSAAQFRKEHPTLTQQKEDGTFETVTLNYDAFLDRNVNGRILKLLTPLLVDEGHTNAQNENTEGLLKALFVSGGGFGNVRYTNPEAVKKFVQGRYSEMNSNEINAVMAQLSGAKERIMMSPDRSDSQELLYGFLKGMTDNNFLGKDLWKNILLKIESDRGGSLGEFVIEFSKSQTNRGIKETILDKIAKNKNLDLTSIKTAGQLYEKISAEDLISSDEIPVEVIQELIPTGVGRGYQSQRDIYRRTITQLMQMPELGGGRNPAMFAGLVRNMKPKDRFSTLQAKTTATPGDETQPNPLAQADQADQQFQQLTQRSADELIQENSGNIDQTIKRYAHGINYAVNLPVSFEGKIVPRGINLGPGKLEDAIRQLAATDSSLPIDEVEAQLKTIDPNIKLNRRGNPRTAATFIRNAQEIAKADGTLDTLASYKTAQEYMPYTKAAPRDESKLNENVSALTSAATTLTEAAQSFASSGGQKTIDQDDIGKILTAVEKARGGDIDVNIDNLRKSLSSNDFSPTTTILDKLLTGFQTMKQAIEETKGTGKTIDDDYLMKLMIKSYQSLEARESVRQAQPQQPPPAPPQPPQQQPPASQTPSGPTSAPPPGGQTPNPEPPEFNPDDQMPPPGASPNQ